MKTKLFISSCALGLMLFIFMTTNSFAQQTPWWKNWEKKENPVMTGISNTWCDNVLFPVVIYDEGMYKMWFTGWNSDVRQIGYAESTDGMDWDIHPDPVLPGGGTAEWNRHKFPGSVLRINDTLHMWYAGSTSNYSTFAVGYAWSVDGIAWHLNPAPVLEKGDPGTWDDSDANNPVVYFDGVKYHMWYSDDDIGYATSYDRINWEKDTVNSPVISHNDLGNWFDKWIYSGGLIAYNDTIHMFFSGFDGTTSSPPGYFRTGYAWTTDYVTWTVENNGEPVMDLGESGSWDSYGTAAESVLFHNGEFKMWYSGQSNAFAVGYASQVKPWWNDWVRCNEKNPVFEGESGTWKDGVIFPTVLKDDGQYKMWFSGITSAWKGQVGYATSGNGFIWIVNDDPVIPFGSSGAWDELRFPGKVLIANDTLRFWYTGFDNQFNVASIGYAWSLDGFDWDIRQNPVLGKGSPGTWNQNYVADPVVHYDGEMYHLYFNTHYDIRYATSIDGISWELYESNPVMLRGPNGSFYDYLIETGGLFVNNDTVHMLFTGMDGSFNEPDSRMRLGYAWSTDYKNWTIGNNGERVFDVGQAGSWDEGGVRFASILTNSILGENRYMMWYAGNSDKFAIGLAMDFCIIDGVLEFTRKTPIPVTAFPNPFTNEVSISFEIPNKATVSLEIYNLNGQLISVLVNENKPQGKHEVAFNAKHLSGGIYFCVLKTDTGITAKKLIKFKH